MRAPMATVAARPRVRTELSHGSSTQNINPAAVRRWRSLVLVLAERLGLRARALLIVRASNGR